MTKDASGASGGQRTRGPSSAGSGASGGHGSGGSGSAGSRGGSGSGGGSISGGSGSGGGSSSGGSGSLGGSSSGGSGRSSSADRAANAWPAGTVIAGRYVIERLIAAGGMSRVYLAMQRPLDRAVALKCLVPLDMDPGFRQRFLLEASVCARLEHPCIVTVHDYGEAEDGALFMATEYLRGQSLATAVSEGGPFTPARVVRVAGGIARALRTAHRAGIVHRDLKPGNVMVVPDDEVEGKERVKLLDFGLVKLFDAVGDRDAPQLTVEGMMLGSPRFMAPEQIIGAPVDPRTDVYALGTLLYLLLDARPPFTASSSAEVLKMHIDTPPPPFTRAVPPLLAALVFRCLEKKPEARFPSMDEVIAVLDRVRDEAASTAPAAYEARAPSFMAPDDTTAAEQRRTTAPPIKTTVRELDAANDAPSDTLIRAAVLPVTEPLADPTVATPHLPDLEQVGWASLFGDASIARPGAPGRSPVPGRSPGPDDVPPRAAATPHLAIDDTAQIRTEVPELEEADFSASPTAPDARTTEPRPLAPPDTHAPEPRPDTRATEPRPLATPVATLSLARPNAPVPRASSTTTVTPTSAPTPSLRAAAAPSSPGARTLGIAAVIIALAGAGTAAMWPASDPPTLRLSSEPSGALVLVDGQPIGFTPLDHVLPAAARGRTLNLGFELEGHTAHNVTVVADRPLVEVSASLARRAVAPGAAPRVALDPTRTASASGPMITVISRPAGARVALDGTEVGVTPYVSALPPGTTICHVRVVHETEAWEADVVPNEAGHFAAVANFVGSSEELTP